MSVSTTFLNETPAITQNWIIEENNPSPDITAYWRRSNPRRFSKTPEKPPNHSTCDVVLPQDILVFKIFPLAIQSTLFKEPSFKLFGKLHLLNKNLRTKLDPTLEILSKVTFGDPCNETQKKEKNNLPFFSKYGKTARNLTVCVYENKNITTSDLEFFFKNCSGVTDFSLIQCTSVHSLSFIQFASNLTILKIESTQLVTYDLKPCTFLENLRSMTIKLKSRESHLDIATLTKCPKLESLEVSCSKVSGLASMFQHASLQKMVFNQVLILEGISRTASRVICRKKTSAEKSMNLFITAQITCQQKPVHQIVEDSQFSPQSLDI